MYQERQGTVIHSRRRVQYSEGGENRVGQMTQLTVIETENEIESTLEKGTWEDLEMGLKIEN
jgi:hypothetical protein